MYRPVRFSPVVKITMAVRETLELLDYMAVQLLFCRCLAGFSKTVFDKFRVEVWHKVAEEPGVAG